MEDKRRKTKDGKLTTGDIRPKTEVGRWKEGDFIIALCIEIANGLYNPKITKTKTLFKFYFQEIFQGQ